MQVRNDFFLLEHCSYSFPFETFFSLLGAALVNFAEDCPKHILIQHLDNVMLKLEAILKGKFNEVCLLQPL